MNWSELFQMQEKLDNKIHEEKGLTREGTFEKRILALLVEVGEWLNEWRGFKYWSNDQEPRTKVLKQPTMNEEDKEYKNLLLEENVDGLHFILSLGNDLGISDLQYREPTKQKDLVGQVLDLYDMISVFRILEGERQKDHYHKMFSQFIRIGQQMGFTMEQVYDAYMKKNVVNYERLANSY